MAIIPITEHDPSFKENWQGQTVPPHVRGGIVRYIMQGVPTGSFLEAVISNDLRQALGKADDKNRTNLFAIVCWFHNHAPSFCWGSPARYRAWLHAHELARKGGDLSAAADAAHDAETRNIFQSVRFICAAGGEQ